jgi:phosphotransacetylase
MGQILEEWIERSADRELRILLADTDERAETARATLTARTSLNVEIADATFVDKLRFEESVVSTFSTAVASLDEGRRTQVESDPLYWATAALRAGVVDVVVAGATRTTADVLRAGLKMVALAPGSTRISSSFLMVMPSGRALSYGDCAVIPEPDAEELAEIAIATADRHRRLTGEEAMIAMLSFSTLGSASHPRASLVADATALVRSRRPDLKVDGELQFDAAIDQAIAATKAPNSLVAGKANTLIFPSLEAGNIAYKLTERLAGATAVGPLLQGFAAPLHDLSRGCTADDIVTVALAGAIELLAN